MNTRKNTRAKHIDFIIADIISIELAFFTAIGIWFERIQNNIGFYRILNAAFVILYTVIMLFGTLHKDILKRGVLRELWKSAVASTELMLVTVGVLFALKESETYSRMVFGVMYLMIIVYMFLIRSLLKTIVKNRFKKGIGNANVLVVTYPEASDKLLEVLKEENNGYYSFKAIVYPGYDDVNEYKYLPVIKQNDVLDYIKDNAINDVYIYVKPGESGKLVEEFLSMGINTHVVLNLEIEDLPNAMLEPLGDYSVINASISQGSAGELIIKRIVDIVASIFGLLITGILFLIFAPIIKLQSPGPVFFSQQRVGKNGKIFKMYKFRSMYADAEERKKELMDQNQMQGLMFKMDNDPRIMPIGKFIRKTSIDEFPQFWNIFKGDMSLVGTRPPTLDEYKQYDPHHLSRLAIKPGLTGMWQTSGRSEITDFEEIVRLDNEYIRNFSLFLDIKLIFKTFITVLGMKGSK